MSRIAGGKRKKQAEEELLQNSVSQSHDVAEKPLKRARKGPDYYHESVVTGDPVSQSEPKISTENTAVEIVSQTFSIPEKDRDGVLLFPDYPNFRPNLTPKEVLQLGSFGGTYYRSIYSSVTQQTYHDQWKEFPEDWFENLNIKKQVTSQNYQTNLNKYKVSCGGDLQMWESSGWIRESDPYGWFQWYCRFYLGRRCSDDERQISRGLGVMGPTGRWRRNLINKCLSSSKPLEQVVDDPKISPKIRQLLQHWGYRLTLKDLTAAARLRK
jgi:hypothetical protein